MTTVNISIDHKILSLKLYPLGLRNPFLSWLVSFIPNRKQNIKYKNFAQVILLLRQVSLKGFGTTFI